MLLVSSVFVILMAGAGAFTLALGIAHLGIPRLVGYRAAIGRVEAAGLRDSLPRLGLNSFSYRLRPSDLIGLTWVMSNAASYVLITIGLLDLAWAAGWRGVPVALGATWIAGWWAVRAASQFALGRRSGDVLLAAWFAALAVVHLALALGMG